MTAGSSLPAVFCARRRTGAPPRAICRFVKHIEQRTRREKVSGAVSWVSCWSGGYGRRAALQNHPENRRRDRNRRASDPVTVAALYLSVVARRIGANQFMPDPQFGSRLLKQRRQSPRCIVVLHFQIIFLPVYDRFSLSGVLDSVPPLIGRSNVLREAVIGDIVFSLDGACAQRRFTGWGIPPRFAVSCGRCAAQGESRARAAEKDGFVHNAVL